MITYNPKDWCRLIFQFHKSDTFRILLPTMIVLGAMTGALVWFEVHRGLVIKSPTMFHQIIGFVLSLLLVFRINTAYERWWEGRKLWGSLVNNSRSLITKLQAILGGRDPHELQLLSSYVATFAYALRDHLRGETSIQALPDLGGIDRSALQSAAHKPLFLYNLIVSRLEGLRHRRVLSDEQLLFLNGEIFSFIDITGACERIKNSPIPFSYSLFLKKIIFVYVITMPLAFSIEFGYWAVPVVMMVFYAFASLEIVSEEVEEPFGLESNDLPTDELADKIANDLRAVCRIGVIEPRVNQTSGTKAVVSVEV